jgi:hypothetical protein
MPPLHYKRTWGRLHGNDVFHALARRLADRDKHARVVKFCNSVSLKATPWNQLNKGLPTIAMASEAGDNHVAHLGKTGTLQHGAAKKVSCCVVGGRTADDDREARDVGE